MVVGPFPLPLFLPLEELCPLLPQACSPRPCDEQAAAGQFDRYASCEECVAAGHGWSHRKAKCGKFSNPAAKLCPSPPPGTAAADPPPVDPLLRKYGALSITSLIPRMAWDSRDPNFARSLSRLRGPAVLSGSPAGARWSAFEKWAQPGYLERQVLAQPFAPPQF